MDASGTASPRVGDEEGWEWAIVEIMGHTKRSGRVREEERFGSKLLRIDVPIEGDASKVWVTFYYSGAALFSYRPSDEETVMKMNRPYSPPAITSLREYGYRSTMHTIDDEAADGEAELEEMQPGG